MGDAGDIGALHPFGPGEGTRSGGFCAAGMGHASCNQTLVFLRTFLPQDPIGCANTEPYAHVIPAGPPAATPRDETVGFTACHLRRAQPRVLTTKPCNELHGEPETTPSTL